MTIYILSPRGSRRFDILGTRMGFPGRGWPTTPQTLCELCCALVHTCLRWFGKRFSLPDNALSYLQHHRELQIGALPRRLDDPLLDPIRVPVEQRRHGL